MLLLYLVLWNNGNGKYLVSLQSAVSLAKPDLASQDSEQFTEKRLKILKVHLDARRYTLNALLVLDEIQIEGKEPIRGQQISQLLNSF